MSDREDMPAGFTQTVVSAAGAPKPDTQAPNSVFALGGAAGQAQQESVQFDAGAAAGPAEPAVKARLSLADRARDIAPVFEACGELSAKTMSQAVADMSRDQAVRIIKWMFDEGQLVETRRHGREVFYKLKTSAFKGWLKKHGDQAAAAPEKRGPGRPRGSKTKPKPALPEIMPTKPPRAASKALSPVLVPVPTRPTWRGALTSAGVIEIEDDHGGKVELDGAAVRGLYGWLTRLDAAGLAGGAA